MNLALLATLVAVANPNPIVLAHRGGTLERGDRVYPEATMPAFREAAKRDFVLEFDVHVTSDGVPVVIHDDTLDRVVGEDCPHRGRAIRELTLAQVRECRVEGQLIPTLAEVLALAERTGSDVSPEIKNTPPVEGLPSDFDPTPAFATAVATALRDSGLPQERMLVQSFWPPDLRVVQDVLPQAQTLFLTLGPFNDGGRSLAAAAGFDWVGPQFPVDDGYVDGAHELGLRVAPYTPNSVDEIRAALQLGVDGVFTDDPLLLSDEVTLAPVRLVGAPRRRGRERMAVFRRSAGRCDFLEADGTLAPPRPCRKRLFVRASRGWRSSIPAELPRGRYRVRFG